MTGRREELAEQVHLFFLAFRRRESRRFWIALILSVLLSLVIEHYWDSLALGERGAIGRAFSTAGGMYQQVLTAGPRSTAIRYTAIVEVTPGVEPDSVIQNVCEQRRFVAKLIHVIEAVKPSVIVLDKFFSPTACAADSAETEQLRAAIGSSIRTGTPVVIGRLIDQETHRVYPTLSLRNGSEQPIEGFVNLHDDTRRVALRWIAQQDGPQPTLELPTIAVVAASAHREELLEEPRLHAAYAAQAYPYASFLSPDQFGAYRLSAMDVLCGKRTGPIDWANCTGNPVALKRLRHRVVLVGDNNPDRDQHPTVLGYLPGVLLHANYVEALLDERVFEGVPRLVELFTAVLVAVAFEYIVIVSSGARQLMFRVLLLATVAFAISYTSVMTAGRYLNPWSVSMGTLLLKIVAKVPEWVRSEKNSPPPEAGTLGARL
jgi:CHASE2 domain-containing sensor protein